MCKALNYFKHFLIFISAVIDFVWIFAFTSLVSVPVGIRRSEVGIKICAMAAAVKKFKSIIKKKKEALWNTFTRKAKLNTIKVLISKPLTDSYISHDEFVSVTRRLW